VELVGLFSQSSRHVLTLTKDDDTGGSISDFLILRPRQLDHGLGSWVCDVDFTEDGMAVVGQPGRSTVYQRVKRSHSLDH
jgi:hypothetical protein